MSRQSKLGDIDLERYQDLMDESHGHPTLEQVEAAIAAAVAEEEKQQQDYQALRQRIFARSLSDANLLTGEGM